MKKQERGSYFRIIVIDAHKSSIQINKGASNHSLTRLYGQISCDAAKYVRLSISYCAENPTPPPTKPLGTNP
jgi:hypothetical protein